MIPKIKNILYATSLGNGAPYVFRYALSIAAAHRADIHVVNAMEPLSTFGQSLVELHISHHQSGQLHENARKTVQDNLFARAKKLCDKESGNIDNGAKLIKSINVLEGRADQIILSMVEDIGADVIVMGTQCHSLVEKVSMGSTASKVLHQAPVPVFFVRIPDGYSEEGFE